MSVYTIHCTRRFMNIERIWTHQRTQPNTPEINHPHITHDEREKTTNKSPFIGFISSVPSNAWRPNWYDVHSSICRAVISFFCTASMPWRSEKSHPTRESKKWYVNIGHRNKNKLSTWDNRKCSFMGIGIASHTPMCVSAHLGDGLWQRFDTLWAHKFFHAEPSNCTHDDAINLTLNDAVSNNTHVCTVHGPMCVRSTTFCTAVAQLAQCVGRVHASNRWQKIKRESQISICCVLFVKRSISIVLHSVCVAL